MTTKDAMITTPVRSEDEPVVPKLGSPGDPRAVSAIQLNTVAEETELTETQTPPHNYTVAYEGSLPHPPGTEPVDAEVIEPVPPGPEE